MVTECEQDYVNRVEDSLSHSPKTFWKYVSDLAPDEKMPTTMSYNNFSSSDPAKISEFFAEFFQSVYTNNSPVTQINSHPQGSSYSCLYPISEDDIYRGINDLAWEKSPGPDGIPNYFIKKCVNVIVDPLRSIFNSAIEEGIFPHCWKTGRVVPIFKKGNKSDVLNYRPITILSAFPKLFEKIITLYLSSILRPYLSLNQYGFTSQRSTTLNLLQLKTLAVKAMEEGYQLDCIYLDWAKAFDRLDWGCLIRKLGSLPIDGHLLHLIINYLQNRSQFVTVKGHDSKIFIVSSGVPQGSHLGPILFNIFINDLGYYLKFCKILKFADDSKLTAVIRRVEDAIRLQDDINNLLTWSKENKLNLNVDKCAIITFTKNKRNKLLYPYSINGNLISRQDTMKDLGVIFDSELSFSQHIDYIRNKALQQLGVIIRNAQLFTMPFTLITLYKMIVRPHLEYACQVWNPASQCHIYNIEKVQHKFLRYFMFRIGSPIGGLSHDYTDALKLSNLETLKLRRAIADLSLWHDLLNGRADSPDLLERIGMHCSRISSRSLNIFSIPFARTKLGQDDTFGRIGHLANRVAHVTDIFSQNRTMYIKAAKSYLLLNDILS